MKQEQQKQSTSWSPKGFIQWLLTILAELHFLLLAFRHIISGSQAALVGMPFFPCHKKE